MRNSIDHVVIGGGLAGSMLALRLASAGREVMLLEKQREPEHKVCGEFLSAEAIGYLQRIGLDPRQLGAHAIDQVHFHSGRKSVRASLPFAALSLTRRLLDHTLLEKAEAAGCEVRRGAFVEELLRNSDSFSIQLRNDQKISARTVFLASGKHDLADLPRSKGSHSDLVGFKMHWRLDPAERDLLRSFIELFLFRDGYGGLALVEDDIANLCFVVRQRRIRELGGWFGLLHAIRNEVPAIDRILDAATQCWPRPLAISPIPYGYLAESANGIWRIGDQAAVIPSFTGDGMSIALHSAELAAEMFLSGKTPDEHLASLRGHLRSGMRFASALSRIMVTSTGRVLAPCVLSIAPGAISWIAATTRIPDRAIRTVQFATEAPAGHSPASAA
jgi:flavin-dependent dehydrogenase